MGRSLVGETDGMDIALGNTSSPKDSASRSRPHINVGIYYSGLESDTDQKGPGETEARENQDARRLPSATKADFGLDERRPLSGDHAECHLGLTPLLPGRFWCGGRGGEGGWFVERIWVKNT